MTSHRRRELLTSVSYDELKKEKAYQNIPLYTPYIHIFYHSLHHKITYFIHCIHYKCNPSLLNSYKSTIILCGNKNWTKQKQLINTFDHIFYKKNNSTARSSIPPGITLCSLWTMSLWTNLTRSIDTTPQPQNSNNRSVFMSMTWIGCIIGNTLPTLGIIVPDKVTILKVLVITMYVVHYYKKMAGNDSESLNCHL